MINKPTEGLVICIGGIGQRKNQLAFLIACDRYAERNSEFRLDFWGPGDPNNPYDLELHQALTSRPWARYRGSAKVQDIPGIMTTADVLVLPSLEDNCPVVILEAMAAGIPVVASDVGGIPDLVNHGKTGFMAPCDQLEKQVEMVGRVVGNRLLRDELAENSRREAMERFTSEAIASFHLEVYRELAVSPES